MNFKNKTDQNRKKNTNFWSILKVKLLQQDCNLLYLIFFMDVELNVLILSVDVNILRLLKKISDFNLKVALNDIW